MTIRIFLTLLIYTLYVYGQTVKVIEPIRKIETGAIRLGMPKISPDGTKLAVGVENQKGLFVMDVDSCNLRKLTDNEASGWNFTWSPTSTMIATRENYWNDRDKMSAIIVYNMDGIAVYSSGRNRAIGLPFWSLSGGSLSYFVDEKTGWKTQYFSNSNESTFLITDSSTGFLCKPSCSSLQNIKFNGEILFAEWSPDKSKLAMDVAGRGLMVYDCINNTVFDIGKGEYPSWINNSYLVLMRVKDDGDKLLSSDVILERYDGSTEKNLTYRSGQKALYPYAHPNGYIFFTNEKGELFRMKVKVED